MLGSGMNPSEPWRGSQRGIGQDTPPGGRYGRMDRAATIPILYRASPGPAAPRAVTRPQRAIISDVVRWGVLSTAAISTQALIPALLSAKGSELRRHCVPHRGARRRRRRPLGMPWICLLR